MAVDDYGWNVINSTTEATDDLAPLVDTFTAGSTVIHVHDGGFVYIDRGADLEDDDVWFDIDDGNWRRIVSVVDDGNCDRALLAALRSAPLVVFERHGDAIEGYRYVGGAA